MLLRNHGILAMGRTLPEAFIKHWALQRACEIQVATMSMGQPIEIAPEVIDRLVWLYMPTIAILWAIAIVFLSFYRIDRARHEENVRRVRESAVVEDLSARAGEPTRLPPTVLPSS
jgi:sterol desaturase/sphingolipid hydroxylase (fatty acid hydroxylase superfamily)